MNNRNKFFTEFDSVACNFDYKYDIVSGPIADDNMAVLFRQYQNDLISLEALINGMTFRETTSQCSLQFAGQPANCNKFSPFKASFLFI